MYVHVRDDSASFLVSFSVLRPNGRIKHRAKDEARASVKRATLMAGDHTHGQSGDKANWPRAAPPPPSALPTPLRILMNRRAATAPLYPRGGA